MLESFRRWCLTSGFSRLDEKVFGEACSASLLITINIYRAQFIAQEKFTGYRERTVCQNKKRENFKSIETQSKKKKKKMTYNRLHTKSVNVVCFDVRQKGPR